MTLREKYKVGDDELLLGYVGRLQRYKQLDKAIIAFQKSKVSGHLILIGLADDDYKIKLNNLVKSDRVHIEYRYLETDEMNSCISEFNAMILPYDKSCLNSGPMLQALLNGTNVLGTAIGTAYDFPMELMYVYDYNSDEDHLDRLIEGLKTIEKDNSSGALSEKSLKLQQFIIEHNNWNEIEKKLNEII